MFFGDAGGECARLPSVFDTRIFSFQQFSVPRVGTAYFNNAADIQLIQLPSQVQDASNQIGQVCPKGIAAIRRLSEFIITGRGSLPPSPLEPLAISPNLVPLATLESEDQTSLSHKHNSTKLDIFSPLIIPTKIVEATGWVKNADGSIELVAEVPSTVPNATGSPLASCLKP